MSFPQASQDGGTGPLAVERAPGDAGTKREGATGSSYPGGHGGLAPRPATYQPALSGRAVHGKPYLYRGGRDLLDVNKAIMDARTPAQAAATNGHLQFFSWDSHRIRLRDSRADGNDQAET